MRLLGSGFGVDGVQGFWKGCDVVVAWVEFRSLLFVLLTVEGRLMSGFCRFDHLTRPKSFHLRVKT